MTYIHTFSYTHRIYGCIFGWSVFHKSESCPIHDRYCIKSVVNAEHSTRDCVRYVNDPEKVPEKRLASVQPNRKKGERTEKKRAVEYKFRTVT